MSDLVLLRRAPRASRLLAVPVVRSQAAEPDAPGRARIYLAPLESGLDRRVILASLARAGMPEARWIPSTQGGVGEDELAQSFLAGEPALVPLSPPLAGPDRLARLLAFAQRAGVEVDLVPLEVLWGPVERPPSLWNLPFGNPYDPPEWTRWLRLFRRGYARVVVGAPGTRTALEAQTHAHGDKLALSAFVRVQAVKALSLAQRQVFGDRYKVPRLLVEQIVAEPSFRDRVAATGATLGLTRDESLQRAERALRELGTSHNLFAMEIFRRFTRWLYTLAYEPEIDVDPGELDKLRELGRRSPLVFVPSHKSNFDHVALYSLLASSGFPPPHTAAGNNMAFFPMNRILPGTGAYFLRRSFQDDPIYKEALRAFINTLVQHRFHQEFFIEGGRSRSGKLLPPRYGILNYVVDGARRHDIGEVLFVPVAIAYDQILELAEYVRQNLGDEKEAESFVFLLGQIRAARAAKLGRIHMRFAEPISLREYLDRTGDEKLVVEKLAFRISNGINAVTPLTPASVACSVLVGAGKRALSQTDFETQVARLLDYARERGIGSTAEVAAGAQAVVETASRALSATGVLERYDGGVEPVYYVGPTGRHAASYYRNTAIHFLVNRAIADLAGRASTADGRLRDLRAFALRLRELLKFEFFFSERDAFVREIEREAQLLARERASRLPQLLAASPRLLLDFLESYWVVTETLRRLPAAAPTPSAGVLKRCHQIGRQLLLQDRVQSPELFSNTNFANALRLLENLGAAERAPAGFRPGDPAKLSDLAYDLEFLIRVARD
ncbi:MAG TPA: 1-acyl-sn-glycerol-3-phosphate acyltransferase [Myxococcota bacterium]|nr:1-acyl-sn-glycerol-3-phosphate acyltransferase [Myxococcota bacterium]